MAFVILALDSGSKNWNGEGDGNVFWQISIPEVLQCIRGLKMYIDFVFEHLNKCITFFSLLQYIRIGCNCMYLIISSSCLLNELSCFIPLIALKNLKCEFDQFTFSFS